MRLKERNSLIKVLDTVQEMFEYVRTVKDKEQVYAYITECKNSVIYLQEHIQTAVEDFNDREFCKIYEICDEILEQDISQLKKLLKKAVRKTEDVKLSIKKGIKVRWTAVFLPYKASMWTALESIWMAADEDPYCDAIVMPIPYYELDAARIKRKLCYEGHSYPDYVPVTDYNEFRIEDEKPEMIFIHNPYDDNNTVTQVSPRFYSDYLKNYTDCLVFSQYFTYNIINLKNSTWLRTPGMLNSDKLIIQSPQIKKVFEKYGYEESRLITVGSPKMDAVVNRMRKPVDMPQGWKEKLHGKKKIFLLNTHMLYFLKSANYAQETDGKNDYGIQWHRDIVDMFLKQTDCALIWRPHPLMKTVMSEDNLVKCERYEDSLQCIEQLEALIDASDNCIIDRTGDYAPAFYFSDALISTYSTLIQEFIALDKPALIFEGKFEAEPKGIYDYRDNYFCVPPDDVSLEQFVSMVLAGDDPLQQSRRRSLEEAFINLDGTAGEKAYQQICMDMQI